MTDDLKLLEQQAEAWLDTWESNVDLDLVELIQDLLAAWQAAESTVQALQHEIEKLKQWEAFYYQVREQRDEHLARLASQEATIAQLEKEKADFHLAYRMDCDKISKAAIQRAEGQEATIRQVVEEWTTKGMKAFVAPSLDETYNAGMDTGVRFCTERLAALLAAEPKKETENAPTQQ
jgi:hypothetical protein